jgi:hypothetical protein
MKPITLHEFISEIEHYYVGKRFGAFVLITKFAGGSECDAVFHGLKGDLLASIFSAINSLVASNQSQMFSDAAIICAENLLVNLREIRSEQEAA